MSRRIIRIRADELMAGDTLVVKQGTIRKFYHVCEVQVHGRKVHYVYKVQYGFVHNDARGRDVLRVREE